MKTVGAFQRAINDFTSLIIVCKTLADTSIIPDPDIYLICTNMQKAFNPSVKLWKKDFFPFD
jgi:hypothetical protein